MGLPNVEAESRHFQRPEATWSRPFVRDDRTNEGVVSAIPRPDKLAELSDAGRVARGRGYRRASEGRAKAG